MKLKFSVTPNDVYLGAFHVFKTSFFRKAELMKFWDWVDYKSFGYEMRTGEQAIVPYAIALAATPGMLRLVAPNGVKQTVAGPAQQADGLRSN